jgi:hypothetical protein
VAVAHGARHAVNQSRIRIEIGRALREVQRVVLRGELTNDGEDRGTDVGQFRANLQGALHGAFSI